MYRHWRGFGRRSRAMVSSGVEEVLGNSKSYAFETKRAKLSPRGDNGDKRPYPLTESILLDPEIEDDDQEADLGDLLLENHPKLSPLNS